MKKSVGFNWGPSAVSTTYWTGFRLSDLLKHCGAKTPLEGARYVHFKGVEKELPQVCQLLDISASSAPSSEALSLSPALEQCLLD